jgi:ABC-2 type transport system permease protein
VTPQGVATVARQEFTIRIRAGRWRLLLTAWFIVLALLTLLMQRSLVAFDGSKADNRGVVVYGALTLLVLALALLVAPTLSAQSVNGDRERGTLATLQVTRLTAGDIAVGKLVAAWGTALVFLVLTFPLIGYCMVLGGVQVDRVLVATVVIALLLGTVAAVALCLSSLLSRPTTSGVLAYLSVFALTVGTLIAFGIGTALSGETRQVSYTSPCPTPADLVGMPEEVKAKVLADCGQTQTYEERINRTDRVWWLLAPNPFVILADAAPQLPPLTERELLERAEAEQAGRPLPDLRNTDPLGQLGRTVRDLRHPPAAADQSFSVVIVDPGAVQNLPKPRPRKLIWPYGLAFDVLLGAGAVWLTARRLTTPTRNLPKGQRVA